MLHPIGCQRPPSPVRWARRAILSAVVACTGLSGAQAQKTPVLPVQGTVDVTTYAYDNGRTGLNSQEILLPPKAINPFFFGKLFTVPVDGYVYAQPLYLHSLTMPDTLKHNVVYVATEHDSVYAFDADKQGAPLWHVSFINPANGVTSVPNWDTGTGDIVPEIGITGTPVIDPNTGTLYLVAKTKEDAHVAVIGATSPQGTTTINAPGQFAGYTYAPGDTFTITGGTNVNNGTYTVVAKLDNDNISLAISPSQNQAISATNISGFLTHYVQRLHALDVHTGAEKPNSPVVIQASVLGNGDGNNGQGNVPFNALINNQRPALLLLNGTVYIGWASHGDNGPYHGWIMGYNATTLNQTSVWNVSPNAVTYGYPLAAGGIWMAGSGPAADAAGNIYLATGNGTFDVNPMSPTYPAYGDSIVKLSTTGGLAVADYFAPFNQQNLDDTDADLGSGGVVLLPGNIQFNGHTHLMVQAGKEGKLYVIDQDKMGHNDNNGDYVAQFIGGAGGGIWGKPSYFNSTIYYGGTNDAIKSFSIGTYRSTNYFYDVLPPDDVPFPATGMTYNGTATVKSGALQLTDGKTNEAGSAFGNLRANVARFTTEFVFTVTGKTPTDYGLSFTIQGDNPGALGQNGGDLGFVGIPSSVSIKWDQVNQSTGLYINGVAQGDINLSLAEINLSSGDYFYVTITYDGTNLQVVTQDEETGAIAIESYPINLASIVGSQVAYVGFTGSTGAAGSTQSIYAWEYTGPTTVQRLFGQSSQTSIGFGYPGPTPVISSYGTSNGVVWAIQSDQYGYGGPAVLHAFDASNLGKELYNSASANENPSGSAVKFAVPVIANGKVYVGSSNGLTVYGSRPVGVTPPRLN